MAHDLVEVLESVYRLRGPDESWMRSVLDSLRPHLDRGFGLVASMIDARAQPSLSVERVVSSGVDEASFERMQAIIAALQGTDERIRRIFALEDGCGTASEVMSELFDSMPHFRGLADVTPVRDFFGMVAADPGGIGCIINAPLPERGRTDEPTRRRWGRVNAHIAAALRLRRAVPALATAKEGELTEDSTLEAILDPNGRVEHAAGPASSNNARALLDAGVRGRERAKVRRLNPEEALSEWSALISGRWTLLDHVESSGRRVILARRNQAGSARVPSLTLEQAQAVGFALLGHSNKLIAYELGLQESTVAMRISRACRRLGVRTRVELMEKLRGPPERTS